MGTGPAGSRPGRDAIRTLVCSGEASLAPSRRRPAAGHGASHRRSLHGSARHRATRTPPQHRTARLGACRHHTPRHGPARMAPEHGTERDGTGRNGAPRQVSARHGTGRDGTARLSGSRTMRHTNPDTGRDRGSRHHTAHPPRDGREGEPRHTQHGTGGGGEPRYHGTPSTAWRGITARHVTASAFGVRRSARSSARHRSPRRINITHQRQNAPSRERRGVLVYPGVSRW